MLYMSHDGDYATTWNSHISHIMLPSVSSTSALHSSISWEALGNGSCSLGPATHIEKQIEFLLSSFSMAQLGLALSVASIWE